MTEDENMPHAVDAGFLRRWSRRKSQVSVEENAADVPPPPARVEGEASPADPDPQASEAPELDRRGDADMPVLASLDADSDYGDFFAPQVSAELRRRALRKLFLSPKFNVRDPLDSEAVDFARFHPLGATITADMRHQLARAEQAKDRLRQDHTDVAAAAPADETAPDEIPDTEDDAGTQRDG
jgi:hypothetical protein